MSGIFSPAFLQSAGRAGKAKENIIYFINNSQDAHIINMYCSGTITIRSTKNGSAIEETYTDLTHAEVTVQNDANTTVEIVGDVTKLNFSESRGTYVGCTDLVYLDVSQCNSLTNLGIDGNTILENLSINGAKQLKDIRVTYTIGLKEFLLYNLPELISITMGSENSGVLEKVYFINTPNLTSFGLYSPPNTAKEIKYAAINSNVSNYLATLISAASSSDGVLYTDANGAYYSTIADAATAKGWTIAQLPA